MRYKLLNAIEAILVVPKVKVAAIALLTAIVVSVSAFCGVVPVV